MPENSDSKKVALAVMNRIAREGRWYGPAGAEETRNRMMKEARAEGLTRAEAQTRVYPELDRLYPPLPAPEPSEPQPEGPAFQGYTGNVDEIIDPAYSEPDAGRRLRDSYIWVGDELRRITTRLPGGQVFQDFARAKRPPPTPLAVDIAEYYGENGSKRGELFGRLASFAEKQHASTPAETPEAASEEGFLQSIE